MDVVHLNQKQLAARWHLSEATLERWRSEGLGPKFLKLCGRVIYCYVPPYFRLSAPSYSRLKQRGCPALCEA